MSDALIVRRGGGGGRYSLLTVTTEEATLQTASVTITGTDSSSGKTDTQTKSMVGGSSKFKLKFLTTYTITCGTVEKTIDIPYYADYSATIALWEGELYIRGNEYTDVTGGWTKQQFMHGQVYVSGVPTLNKASDHLGLNLGSGNTCGGIYTINGIDMTDFSSLKVVAKTGKSSSKKIWIGLKNAVPSFNENITNATNFPTMGATLPTTETTFTVDISGKNGLWYPMIATYAGDTNIEDLIVYEVYME